MIVSCEKTGRHWPAATFGIARGIARQMGLTDWVFCPKIAPVPATIRETTMTMRSAGRRITPAEQEARHARDHA